MFERIRRLLIGAPRNIQDPRLYHQISLAAFLAWIGVGVDGLSSSAYGPDEAFRALTGHPELALFLAAATAITVFVISYAYARTIEQFPSGGGGYAVATKLLGGGFGVVSGCALLVDYVLTITVSIASGADQVFSFLPTELHTYKLPLEFLGLVVLVVMNLRGVKESIKVLMPVFLLFIFCHVVMLGGIAVTHFHDIPATMSRASTDVQAGVQSVGFLALFLILARAYAHGAGTYTGIEAVSNSLDVLREPKVATAKRTMLYMAVSLAVLAGGILVGYLVLDVQAEPGKTLNAVLLERLGFGQWFVVMTLVTEAALLCLAAQTGVIGGPRVLANMALDSWIPHRFGSLSERLALQDGVILMGAAGAAALLYAHGDISTLVTMYAINVFITFSLTQLGMCRFWIRNRASRPEWKRVLPTHVVGLLLCVGILAIVIYEKFFEGAWVTLAVTGVLIVLCFLIRRYYRTVQAKFVRLAEQFDELPLTGATCPVDAKLDPDAPTAALLVSGYGGLGLHSLVSIQRLFPNHYKQVVFVSVGVMDMGNYKGIAEVDRLKAQTQANLDKYVDMAHRFGLAAASRMRIGTDPVSEAAELCSEVAQQFPKVTFFAGNLVFQKETWYQRLFHNETAFAVQRRLHWLGLPMLILPIRA